MNKQTLSTKTLSTLKVIILALVLGLGISYAQAVWTGPLASPPNCTAGNPGCDAPINVSATAQTKTGDFTAGGLTLSKYPSGGPNSFISPSGTSTKALHLTSGYAGFTDINNLWRWYVLENGDTNQPGKANASDFCINGGGCLGAGAGIPVGGIIMWSGSTANIPSGWKLCNGNNGTPNLSGRFIVGAAGSTYVVGASGGSATASLVDHRHIYPMSNEPQYVWTLDNFRGPLLSSSGYAHGGYTHIYYAYNTSAPKKNTGLEYSNTNSIVVPDDNTANLPPYYALAFIMRAW